MSVFNLLMKRGYVGVLVMNDKHAELVVDWHWFNTQHSYMKCHKS